MISGPGLSNYISVRTGRAEYEVADVLRTHLTEYKEQYPLTAEQARVCGALMVCRTAQLGGHVDQCLRNYPAVVSYWVLSLSYLSAENWACGNGWRPLFYQKHEAELDRCPACGGQQTMARQREFDEVSWLGLLFLSLFGLKGYQEVRL